MFQWKKGSYVTDKLLNFGIRLGFREMNLAFDYVADKKIVSFCKTLQGFHVTTKCIILIMYHSY